jgi:hypothetical protein
MDRHTAYFDCPSGISGDMVLGAMVDAGVPLDLLNQRVATLGVPGLRFEAGEVRRLGMRAIKVDVRHEPEHKHRHLRDIETIIRSSSLSRAEQELAIRLFQVLAEAEAKVHGCDVQKVHFHEVGAVDSIADIVGVAVGLQHFGIEAADFSPIPVGRGFVQIAHGRVAVPAPATAELLRGVALAASEVDAELTTPTGAAIVRILARQFGGLPAMTLRTIGCGAGSREMKQQPNILRLFLGAPAGETLHDHVLVLETNLDDVSPEIIGDCCERLRAAGALDVYTTAIGMKKNRPGIKITVLADPDSVQRLEAILFAATRSLGVRRWLAIRDKLPREPRTVPTKFGPIHGKSVQGPGFKRAFVPEYESCREAAEHHGVPQIDVYEEAARQASGSGSGGGDHAGDML